MQHLSNSKRRLIVCCSAEPLVSCHTLIPRISSPWNRKPFRILISLFILLVILLSLRNFMVKMHLRSNIISSECRGFQINRNIPILKAGFNFWARNGVKINFDASKTLLNSDFDFGF